MASTFSKFIRPEVPDRGRISARDLDIIEAILRYRFSPTSELVRLVGGNEDFAHRRLRMLWEWQIVNRFAFPGFRSHSEFVYYLDQKKALEVLANHGRLPEIHPRMEDELEANKQADYAGAAERGQYMQLGFLKHSLMISRLHFALEQACRKSKGIELTDWRQGSQIARHKVVRNKVVRKSVLQEREANISGKNRARRKDYQLNPMLYFRSTSTDNHSTFSTRPTADDITTNIL